MSDLRFAAAGDGSLCQVGAYEIRAIISFLFIVRPFGPMSAIFKSVAVADTGRKCPFMLLAIGSLDWTRKNS